VKGFQNLMPPSCSGVRDGHEVVISSEELVVGDLVFVRNGSRVPADVRMLTCSGLKLETSSITGKQIKAVASVSFDANSPPPSSGC
jgi:P-type E1-E2 ATPase